MDWGKLWAFVLPIFGVQAGFTAYVGFKVQGLGLGLGFKVEGFQNLDLKGLGCLQK